MAPPEVVLSIAGFDPSSGAGTTADIKTIAAHGCFGTACITALTVQSTAGVKQVQALPAALVRATLQELASDLPPAAIRIGMLGSGDIALTVAEFLAGLDPMPPVVLDPIIRSSSGAALLDAAGLEVLQSRLLPLATVVTPNLEEAAELTGLEVRTSEQMRLAAARLHELGSRAVVVKGGHLQGNETLDLLSQPTGEKGGGSGLLLEEFRGPRLESRATHGTGCAFATALACNLALGKSLSAAVAAAKRYVTNAISGAHALGHGHGPINHLYRLEQH